MSGQATTLHHIVFAVTPGDIGSVAQMFTELGFAFDNTELAELGLEVHLDWERGLELITPLPDTAAAVAGSVNKFLDQHGNGVYTVVLRVPRASDAEAITQQYGSATRFRQSFSGDGTYLDEIDLSAFGLPLTLLATNVP